MQLFGAGKTPAEKMKEYNRNIKRSIREMDRERNALERQEKKLMTDIKKEAKEGRVDSAKIMAKDLVRTRGYIKKMYKMKSHMEAVSLRLQTMQSSAQMVRAAPLSHRSLCLRTEWRCTEGAGGKRQTGGARRLAFEGLFVVDLSEVVRGAVRTQAQSMKGVVKVMGTMNKKMNLPQIQKIMMEFEKQNEMMGAPPPRA